jgi:poly(A) polymerase
LYPFVPESSFATAKEKVAKALRGFGPFTIHFNSMGYFSHGRNATLFLKPTPVHLLLILDVLLSLGRSSGKASGTFKGKSKVLSLPKSYMQDAFPFCDDLNTMSSAGFQPHLTLGQFPSVISVVTK